MASGLPVVASNSSSFPEICGDAACYFDPFDVTGMTRAMERVLTDPSQRSIMIQKGYERARTFTWEKAASKTLKVLEGVCCENSR
jgi:glycosyltransferase involved in cell wall biosynthesis